jgi:hypothetical protein
MGIWGRKSTLHGSTRPEEDAIDFDVYDVDVYYEVSDEVEVDENDEFSEPVEYFDNQWW